MGGVEHRSTSKSSPLDDATDGARVGRPAVQYERGKL